MKISLEWIKRLLPDLKVAPAVLEKRLNASGVEVASVTRPQDGLTDVVVAEVRKVEPHPDANRLKVTEVYDGTRSHQVVCGAPNVEAGLKVPFAPVGTELPNGLKLEARPIRGVESSGMLCSADELGLGVKSEGLMILKPRLKPGRPLAEALRLKDAIFELELTPNRADLLSHVGVARELAALFDLKLPAARTKVKEAGPAHGVTVRVEAKDRCPLYACRVIQGVKVGPSPVEVQQRLLALGQRPVSNVVDATNLALLELGHPLHAFDLAKLEGAPKPTIRVRLARAGEQIRLLDGSTQTLSDDDLVIADDRGPVALAGVMGGSESEVSDETTDIVLESALFDARGVRRTSKRHALHTEASHRFERGVDPQGVLEALEHCAHLVLELAGGEIAKGVGSAGSIPKTEQLVPIRPERASVLLGREVTRQEVRGALRRLGLKAAAGASVPKKKTQGLEDAIWFRPPSWRRDLTREVDLIEEVARLGGYDAIPSLMPDVAAAVRTRAHRPRLDARLQLDLAGLGFQQLLSLGFASPGDAERFGVAEGALVELLNPLGEETRCLRFSLLPALLQAAQRNQDQLPSRTDLRLFEIGRVFTWTGPDAQPHEENRLGLLMRGHRHARSWSGSDAQVDAFDLKGVAERIVDRAGLSKAVRFERHELSFMHPRATARIWCGDRVLGAMGQVHPDVMQAYDLEGPPVYVAELSMDVLAEGAHRHPFRRVSPHPPAQRDLSFVVSKEVPVADLLATIREAGRVFDLESVQVFDVFEGKNVPEGHRSIAVALTYRAPNRTLTAQEVEAAQTDVVARLESEHGAKLRA